MRARQNPPERADGPPCWPVRVRRRHCLVPTAIIALLSMALAACTGPSGSPGGTASDAVLEIGGAGQPASLDPQAGTTGNDYYYLNLIYDRLMRVDPKTGELLPGLATSWKYLDAENRHFEFTLRDGVTFQDGTELDANAVKASMQRFIAQGTLTQLDAVQNINVKNPKTVDITLSRPSSSFALTLADRAGMIVSPTAAQKYGDQFGTHPVGAGPFQFASEVSGSSINLTKFKNYWQADRIKLAGFNWHIYANKTALTNALQAEQVQMGVLINPADVAAFKGNNSVTVDIGPAYNFFYLAFNIALKPLDDVKIRQAINLALDRTALNDVGTQGLGKVEWEPIPPSSPFYATNLAPTWPQDVAKAKQLVAEAGYPNGVNLTCLNYTTGGYDDTAPVVIAQLKKVGINVNVTTVSLAEFSDLYRTKRTAPCGMTNFGVDPAPVSTLRSLFAKDSYFNSSQKSFGVDDDLTALDAAFSQQEQQNIVAKIVAQTTSTAPYAPLFSTPKIAVLQKTVRGYVPSVQGYLQDLSGLSVTG